MKPLKQTQEPLFQILFCVLHSPIFQQDYYYILHRLNYDRMCQVSYPILVVFVGCKLT